MIAESLALTPIDRLLADVFGASVYTVGGRVRDHFLSQGSGRSVVSKDADYVVAGLALDDVLARLGPLGRIDTVGKRFGVIKLTLPDAETVDIALARRERSTGVGHRDFELDFGPEVTIEEDLGRRDFTVNAVAVRLADRHVVAVPGALDDVAARRLRMVFANAFVEDPVRIVRGVQFASRFALEIEPATAHRMFACRALVAEIDPEPMAAELIKLLEKSPAPSAGIRLLRDYDLLDFTIPELGEGIGLAQNVFHLYDVFEHNLHALDVAAKLGGDLTDRLAALLHDVGKPRTVGVRPDGKGNSFHGHEFVSEEIARARLRALRFASALIDDVAALAAAHMYRIDGTPGVPLGDAALRRFIRLVGRGAEDRDLVRARLTRQFALRYADRHASVRNAGRDEANDAFERRVFAEIDREPPLTVKALAITGEDVIHAAVELGLRSPGYRGDTLVGRTLNALLEHVTENPDLNVAATLKAMIPAEIARAALNPRAKN